MNTSKSGKLLPCSRYFFAWVCHHYRSWRIRWCRRHLYFHLGTRYSGPNVSFSEFHGLIIHFKNHLCLAYPWRWCLQRSWKWLSWWLFRTVCRTRRAYPRSRCCFPHNEHTSKSCLLYFFRIQLHLQARWKSYYWQNFGIGHFSRRLLNINNNSIMNISHF